MTTNPARIGVTISLLERSYDYFGTRFVGHIRHLRVWIFCIVDPTGQENGDRMCSWTDTETNPRLQSMCMTYRFAVDRRQ